MKISTAVVLLACLPICNAFWGSFDWSFRIHDWFGHTCKDEYAEFKTTSENELAALNASHQRTLAIVNTLNDTNANLSRHIDKLVDDYNTNSTALSGDIEDLKADRDQLAFWFDLYERPYKIENETLIVRGDEYATFVEERFTTVQRDGPDKLDELEGIRKVIVEKTVTRLEPFAFAAMKNLIEVVFEEGSPITTIPDVLFVSSNKLSGVTLPSGLEMIGNSAFKDCNLTSITLPDSLQEIRAFAFDSNGKLESVVTGNNSSLEKIGNYAFQGCTSLKSIRLPDSLKEIGSYAFAYSYNLTSVTIGTNSSLEKIGKSAFRKCTSLKSIRLPDRDGLKIANLDGINVTWV